MEACTPLSPPRTGTNREPVRPIVGEEKELGFLIVRSVAEFLTSRRSAMFESAIFIAEEPTPVVPSPAVLPVR